MPGCITRCTTYRTDSIANAWLDIRGHFGPIVPVYSDIYLADVGEWAAWAADNGINVIDVSRFGKWLIWKCSYGTTNYGRLPTKIRDHTGISCIPCPFDADSYDAVRAEVWLGYIPTSLSDHANYYMKVAHQGSWGFECTYSGCPYLIEHGRPYFHA
jgi:hypothetical protein